MVNNARTLRKVATVTMVANILLLVLKLVISLIFDNFAVFSDAMHSAADLLTSIVIIVVSYFISAKSDRKHNYGHERIEALFTLVLSFVVFAVSVILAWEGIEGLIHPETPDKSDYLYLIITVVVSILIKEGMFWYGIYYAKKIKSEMLRMTAWHNRSDSLSSVAVLLGLVCSTFTKNDVFENIAVIIVALLIIHVAFEIFVESANQLIDRAASATSCARIKDLTKQVKGVKDLTDLKTRLFGNRLAADLTITVDAKLTVPETEKIVSDLENQLLSDADLNMKHCTVEVRAAK